MGEMALVARVATVAHKRTILDPHVTLAAGLPTGLLIGML